MTYKTFKELWIKHMTKYPPVNNPKITMAGSSPELLKKLRDEVKDKK